ncbi:MAG: TolC family protein [Flavobacteriales bacterium]|nr:TolC family protein [Flavobacteriales bacterium]
MRSSIILFAVLLFAEANAQQKWTLEQCVQRAEDKNLTVRDAQLNAELADRTHDQAFWSFLPNLNAGGTHGYNYGRVIDRFTNTFATDRVRTNNFWLNSDLAIYQGGRVRNTYKQTQLDELAAAKGLEASRNDVRVEVVRGYLNVLGLRERITAAEAQAANSREQITRVQALVDAGRSARGELLDINAQLASEEYTVTDLQNQHDQALLQLGQALRLEPNEMNGFDIATPQIGNLVMAQPVAKEDDVLGTVLATNPAYAQSELNAQSAEKGVTIARSGMLPSLGFNASVGTGYSGRNFETVGEPIISEQPIGATETGEIVYAPSFDFATQTRPFGKQLDDNLNESISFTLSVPIFNNKQNSLAADRARIQHEQAKNRQESQRLSLQRDVQNALVAQRNAFRQYESARKSVEASEGSLGFAQERFTQNVITAIELNTAKVRVQQATADLINAKYSYLMAQKSLDILQGLPLTL